jgi:hypothetical protein
MKQMFSAMLILLTLSNFAWAKSETVYEGKPIIKISESSEDRVKENISLIEAWKQKCIISKRDNNYYWASRNNVELIPVDSGGAFITFIAVTGSGYIRVIKPEWKEMASVLSPTEKKYDYVEHINFTLRSIAYYGVQL